jgi:hypothetical protein
MDAIQILREFGMPSMFLIAGGYAVWQGAQWIAIRVVIPLQDRHFAFLAHLQEHLDTMSATQSQLVNDLRRLSESLENRMASWESNRRS